MSTQKNLALNSSIPFPHFESWLHKRQVVPKESSESIQNRYQRQPISVKVFDSIFSRFFAFNLKYSANFPHLMYKLIVRSMRLYLRVVNRLKVFGINNVPQEGAIFYVNHPGQLDPIILLASLPVETGALIAWGNNWFMDMLEHYFGLLSLRKDGASGVVERIVRHLLLRNRYFAIWPEGHPTYSQKIEDGHSSIIRVYGVVNHDKDRIPFVPVLLRGAHCYRIKEYSWPAENPNLKRNNPIEIHILPPIYFPRDWLLPPEKGGKSPREMIDYLMNTLAIYQKQRKLRPNRLLEMRRQGHAKKEQLQKALLNTSND
jgi:1-acyl-sn-glycerol-3-phosphate acyltransferase